VDAGSSRRYPLTTLRADHRRAIDRYIDYVGDRAATGPESRARPVPSLDEPPSHDEIDPEPPRR